MKRQLTLFVITGLLACGSSVANANLLSNGNLDVTSISGQTLATPTGWIASANRSGTGPFSDGLSSENFANVLAPGTTNVWGVFFKPFQGQAVTNTITAKLFQDNPATPGLSYSLTGWAGAGANYIGLTDPTVGSFFHLEFFNAASVLLSDNALNLTLAGLGSGAPTPPATGFGYHPFTLNGTAPATTAFVRVLAEMDNAYNNPLGGDQAFVVDAFDLEIVPEPSVISLAGLSIAGLLVLRRRR